MKRSTTIGLTALAAILCWNDADAQITLIGAATQRTQVLRTLGTAGIKLIDEFIGQPTVTIRDLDLGVYRNLTVPPPLPGYTYIWMGYVTEALFDTDPSTLEYAVQATNGLPGYVAIYRENGTQLMIQNQARFSGNLGLAYLASDGVVNTPNGSYMVLDSTSTTGTTVYLLPGTMPCLACDGSMMTGSGADYFTAGANITAFPNPTSNDATIRYDLPVGTTKGSLVFFDTQGQEVKRLQVNGSGTKHITTADMAAGTYLYQLETGRGVIGAKRLVVVK